MARRTCCSLPLASRPTLGRLHAQAVKLLRYISVYSS